MSLIIANWKMNLCNDADKIFLPKNIDLLIAPPYTHLSTISTEYKLCAQDVSKHDYEKGSFTGEVSASMLRQMGCKYCIVGHSERRLYFNEDTADIAKKIKNLNQYNITPIICIGETIKIKEEGSTTSFLIKELEEILKDSNNNDNFMIAYEPVWAIGSGIVATIAEITEVAESLSAYLMKKFEKKIQVVYGGSVNKESINSILKINNIDGVLIGGACLDTNKFNEILKMVDKL